MNLQQAQNLKIDETVFYEYEKAKVQSEARDHGNGNERIDILKGDFLHGAHVSNVFLPTEHVEQVSNMVAEKRKEFTEMNCFGANINPSIFGLFTDHWTNMCNAEGNDKQYQIHKAAFEHFIKGLFEVANVINNAAVMGVLFLRR